MPNADYDHRDIHMITENADPWTDNDQFQTPLIRAVANGRLFLLNNRGEYEKVTDVSYWYDNNGHEEIRSTVSNGYEFDEDGQITRDWRNANS